MIEMLGVLAIIGVLSVGGIAGYSKAMNKYRINKAIEQITLIAGNVRAFFAPQKNYLGAGCRYFSNSTTCGSSGCQGNTGLRTEKGIVDWENNGCPIIKKAKIFPDEMITVEDGKITAITNPFGFQAELASVGDCKDFDISYHLGDNLEACIELATHDWTAAGVKSIGVTGFGNGCSIGISDSMEQAVDCCSRMNNMSRNYGNNATSYPYITFIFK